MDPLDDLMVDSVQMDVGKSRRPRREMRDEDDARHSPRRPNTNAFTDERRHDRRDHRTAHRHDRRQDGRQVGRQAGRQDGRPDERHAARRRVRGRHPPAARRQERRERHHPVQHLDDSRGGVVGPFVEERLERARDEARRRERGENRKEEQPRQLPSSSSLYDSDLDTTYQQQQDSAYAQEQAEEEQYYDEHYDDHYYDDQYYEDLYGRRANVPEAESSTRRRNQPRADEAVGRHEHSRPYSVEEFTSTPGARSARRAQSPSPGNSPALATEVLDGMRWWAAAVLVFSLLATPLNLVAFVSGMLASTRTRCVMTTLTLKVEAPLIRQLALACAGFAFVALVAAVVCGTMGYLSTCVTFKEHGIDVGDAWCEPLRTVYLAIAIWGGATQCPLALCACMLAVRAGAATACRSAPPRQQPPSRPNAVPGRAARRDGDAFSSPVPSAGGKREFWCDGGSRPVPQRSKSSQRPPRLVSPWGSSSEMSFVLEGPALRRDSSWESQPTEARPEGSRRRRAAATEYDD